MNNEVAPVLSVLMMLSCAAAEQRPILHASSVLTCKCTLAAEMLWPNHLSLPRFVHANEAAPLAHVLPQPPSRPPTTNWFLFLAPASRFCHGAG